MKNSTTFAIVFTLFATLSFIAFGMQNPEIFEAHHSVDGYGIHSEMSNLGSIILMTLPFASVGIVTLVALLWHKEKENTKVVHKVLA